MGEGGRRRKRDSEQERKKLKLGIKLNGFMYQQAPVSINAQQHWGVGVGEQTPKKGKKMNISLDPKV